MCISLLCVYIYLYVCVWVCVKVCVVWVRGRVPRAGLGVEDLGFWSVLCVY